jgi:hypothetical protein
MGTYLNPFDFKKIFVNYFLGSQQLFVYALVIIFSYVAAKYQMSNMMFFTLLIIASVMFAAFIGEAVYFLILLLVGFIVFKSLSGILT